jgi:hypothetical protein
MQNYMDNETARTKYEAIRKEDLPQTAQLLDYASSVGSAVIQKEDVALWRKDNWDYLYESTREKIEQKQKYFLMTKDENLKAELTKDAYTDYTTIMLGIYLLEAKLNFIPRPHQELYLYQRENREQFISLIAPQEWKKRDFDYLCKIQYTGEYFKLEDTSSCFHQEFKARLLSNDYGTKKLAKRSLQDII